jgi:glyoxylase-like metal-dependent hydrolase (beta-lactamase superfamily II)
MASVDLVPLVDEGLGNTSYLVDLGDGRALVVDVSRDLRLLHQVMGRRGLRVAFAAETHLHSDFLSGACQLAARAGARALGSADGERAYPHSSLRDGDEVDLGGLRLRVLATPGHTHEHLSYLLLDGDRPAGVFTGGSLLVGAAARSDLVSPEKTEALARAQYASLRRLARLPDEVAVWPTHGAGSFCTTPAGAERTSTIGREKATNPLLNVPGEDAFVAALTSSVGSFPPYFLRLPEINRIGPPPVDRLPTLAGLNPAQVQAYDEDVVVGYWTTIKFSGALDPERHDEMITRLNERTARAEARMEIALDSIDTEALKIEEDAQALHAAELVKQFKLEMGMEEGAPARAPGTGPRSCPSRGRR